MKRRNVLFLWVMVIGGAVCLVLGAGAGATAYAAEKEFACVQENKIEKEISPEAQLEKLTCFFKRFEGVEALHFKVAIKNVSKTPQRYRVQIFLDNGKAVGGLIPRKTKKGLVQPGQTATFVYPVNKMTTKPDSIFLKIATKEE